MDTSHPVADKHGVHGRPRNSDTVLPVMGYCSGSQRLGFRSAEDVIQSWNPHSTLAGQQIVCDEIPRMTTTWMKSGRDIRRGSGRPTAKCLMSRSSSSTARTTDDGRRQTGRARIQRDTVREGRQRPLHHRQRAKPAATHIKTCSARAIQRETRSNDDARMSTRKDRVHCHGRQS